MSSANSLAPARPHPVIPEVDFLQFQEGTESDRRAFGLEFVESLGSLGFVTIVNHPFSESEVAEALSWNQRFFALPHEEKMKAAHPLEANPHRGYSYVGQERLTAAAEIKETFDQGPSNDLLYPNRWPSCPSILGFQPFLETFFDRCHEFHLTLISAIELGADLSPNYLSSRCRKNSSEMRINHYPTCNASQIFTHGAKRIAEHADFGVLTLLFQDDVGGLEIERKDEPGRFFPVPVSGTAKGGIEARNVMVVNAGQCLQRWTNDRLLAARHRVMLPTCTLGLEEVVPERYSIAYFGKPDRDENVGSLDPFCVDRGAKYEKMTAWEFNQSRLGGTY